MLGVILHLPSTSIILSSFDSFIGSEVDDITQERVSDSWYFWILSLIKNLYYMAWLIFWLNLFHFLTGKELDMLPRRKKKITSCDGVSWLVPVFLCLRELYLSEAPMVLYYNLFLTEGFNAWDSKPDRVLGNYSTTQNQTWWDGRAGNKDGQFVMMHDANENLAGINKVLKTQTWRSKRDWYFLMMATRLKFQALKIIKPTNGQVLIEIKTSKR